MIRSYDHLCREIRSILVDRWNLDQYDADAELTETIAEIAGLCAEFYQ